MKNLKWLFAAVAVCVVFGMIGCAQEPVENEGTVKIQYKNVMKDDVKYAPDNRDGTFTVPATVLYAVYDGDYDPAKDLVYKWDIADTANASSWTAKGTTDTLTLSPSADYIGKFVRLTVTHKDADNEYNQLDVVKVMETEEFFFTQGGGTEAQFKYAGTWVGKEFTSQNTFKYTETVVIDVDKFNLTNTNNDTQNGSGEHMTFAVTKWDAWPGSPALSIPSSSDGLPSGFTANNGWILTGTMTSQKGYDNYTRIIMFLSDDGTKFIRGTVSAGGAVGILSNAGRVFERPTATP